MRINRALAVENSKGRFGNLTMLAGRWSARQTVRDCVLPTTHAGEDRCGAKTLVVAAIGVYSTTWCMCFSLA